MAALKSRLNAMANGGPKIDCCLWEACAVWRACSLFRELYAVRVRPVHLHVPLKRPGRYRTTAPGSHRWSRPGMAAALAASAWTMVLFLGTVLSRPVGGVCENRTGTDTVHAHGPTYRNVNIKLDVARATPTAHRRRGAGHMPRIADVIFQPNQRGAACLPPHTG